MAAERELTICGGDYEHTLGIGGTYDGIDLAYRPMRVQDIFVAMLETARFEICEFSLANYLTLRAAGQDWMTAVPVFPSRVFRHSLAVTRRESTLTTLEALAGKRVGVEDYSMTAAVWFRGLLQDEYGIAANDIRWVTRAKQRFPFPPGANVETTDRDLQDLAFEGAIDATLATSLTDAARPEAERRLRPVLADPQAAEQAYYRRTGIFPIMHCVVIRGDVLAMTAGIGNAVYQAYEKAKARAYQRQLGATLLPWGKENWARTFEFFSGDPLPYGLTPTNVAVIERLGLYLQQQGFMKSAPDVATLFA